MAAIDVWKQLWEQILTTTIGNPILVAFLLFSFLFCLLKRTRGRRDNLPPSPPRLPIIGNFHQLGTVPHRSLQALAEKYGPLILLHFGSIPTLVVSSAEIAREILKTQETKFLNRTTKNTKAADVLLFGCTDLVFSPSNEYWRQVRKICVLELLSLRRVQSFQYVREEEVGELVEKIRRSCLHGSSVNLGKMMVTISNNIVSRSVLGQKFEGGKGGEIASRAFELLGAFCFEDMFPSFGWIDFLTGFDGRLKETSETLHAYLDEIIDEHQISKSDQGQTDKKDFVDTLLHLQNNGLLDFELTRDNIKAILVDMLVAGTDTASAAMEWVMAELVKKPSIMKKVQEEVRTVVGNKSKVEDADVNQMGYLKCVIKETLRLHSVFLLARESSARVKLAGYDIPPKTRVFIHVWAIQRDPNLWDRPEEFLPERFTNDPLDFKGQDLRFCPFGSGRRGCPGITYGVMEMELVIANLLYWFDWRLPDGATADGLNMDESFSQVNRKKIPLTVVPVLHIP